MRSASTLLACKTAVSTPTSLCCRTEGLPVTSRCAVLSIINTTIDPEQAERPQATTHSPPIS